MKNNQILVLRGCRLVTGWLLVGYSLNYYSYFSYKWLIFKALYNLTPDLVTKNAAAGIRLVGQL